MADQQSPGLLANILAVAGFIILIVIIVWGAYHLLLLTGSGVSSIFSRFTKNDAIAITVPESVTAGEAFPLSWKYSPKEDGTYAFLYQCKSGFRFDAQNASGSTGAIPCGNALPVGANTALLLTPSLSGTTSADIPVSVIFIPNATTTIERPQGTATVHVVVSTGSPASPTQPSQPSAPVDEQPETPPQPATPADLSVRILAKGVIDQYGTFLQRAPSYQGDVAAVKFDIANVGGTASGMWYFTAQLPTMPSYAYTSPAQISLAPGAHIENTLRFTQVQQGGGTILINVDPQNLVRESNEGNNSASEWMNAQNWTNYPYQQPYVY